MVRAAVDHSVLLGYEVGSGDEVRIPIRNMAVVGQTQESGKTTTLEALVSRAPDVTALAFVTKRGERSFADAPRVTPYFRDRADWQFVMALIDAVLQEKNKFLRPWVMRICRTTSTLADVQREVRKALRTAKGVNEGVYTQLDAYLDLIVPEIERLPFVAGLELEPGLNVMDLGAFNTPMQMLFVQSAIDWVNAHSHNTIVVVPEAWEFIPEGKGSPVKASAIDLVRKGSAIGNRIWVDSQDTAGVDKVILRGCPVWLLGVQREANEIKRNLANIPATIQRPKASEIAHLDRGQFFACWKDRTVKVYVRPEWLNARDAQAIARGEMPASEAPMRRRELPALDAFVRRGRAAQRAVDEIVKRSPSPPPTEADVKESEAKRLVDENEQLRQRIQVLEGRLHEIPAPLAPPNVPAPRASGDGRTYSVDESIDNDRLFQAFKQRLIAEAPAILKLIAQKPELHVEMERNVVDAGGDSLRARIGKLMAEGFFDERTTGGAVQKELARRGFNTSPGSLYPELENLSRMGFLTIDVGVDERSRQRKEFQLVPGAVVNVVNAKPR